MYIYARCLTINIICLICRDINFIITT